MARLMMMARPAGTVMSSFGQVPPLAAYLSELLFSLARLLFLLLPVFLENLLRKAGPFVEGASLMRRRQREDADINRDQRSRYKGNCQSFHIWSPAPSLAQRERSQQAWFAASLTGAVS